MFLRKSPVYKGFCKALILGTMVLVVAKLLGVPINIEQNCNN
ncbi:MAG: hypothetical protein ACE37L_10310 [Allomuricauda sp.]